MGSRVTTETATVYVGATRRYFTRRAAERSFAKAAILKLCECEVEDYAARYPGATCWFHRLPAEAFAELINLYTKRFVKANRGPSQEELETLLDEIDAMVKAREAS